MISISVARWRASCRAVSETKCLAAMMGGRPAMAGMAIVAPRVESEAAYDDSMRGAAALLDCRPSGPVKAGSHHAMLLAVPSVLMVCRLTFQVNLMFKALILMDVARW